MERSERETAFALASNVLAFAVEHPYAATGVLGAAIGSAVTYKALTYKSVRDKVNGVFTPKVYELALSHEDLRRMLADPLTEIRIETAEMTIVVTAEKREELKQLLPDIVIE